MKSKLLLTALSFIFFNIAVAQDCAELVIKTTDKMTGEKTVASKNLVAVYHEKTKKGLGIEFQKTIGDPFVIMTFTVSDGKSSCLDKEAEINFLFKNGEKMTIISDTDFNCDGEAVIYFAGIFGKEDLLNKLREEDVETIRVWTYKSHIQEDFSPEKAARIRKTLNCVFDSN